MSLFTLKKINMNDKIVTAVVADDSFIEHDNDLINIENGVKTKKRAKDIQITPGVIPSKEDIHNLCMHGMYNKIKMIEKSYFTKFVREELIRSMKNKIDDIKIWMDEPVNKDRIGYFQNRKGGIFKIIHYLRSMDIKNI